MSDRGITRENLLLIVPPALTHDKSMMALAQADAGLLAARPAEIERVRIYPAIDTLDEALLDILARDFKVDWWDQEYSLEEKRRTMKDSWYVHKKLGTAGAVKRAVRAIYPNTEVEPWYEYEDEGGEPYHFRMKINITSDSMDLARQRRVLERLRHCQSLRDRMDQAKYFLMPEKAWAVAGGGFAGSREVCHVTVPVPVHRLEKPGGRTRLAAGGALFGIYRRIDVSIPVPG